MQRSWKIVCFLFLMVILASGTSLVMGQNPSDFDPQNFESNSLLFVQQDVLPSFGQPTGVRLGTVKGLISGNITTNFTFTTPPPGPPGGPFVADDYALIVDPDGDQILFNVKSQGNASYDTLHGDLPLIANLFNPIVPFKAPFLATYRVLEATGKLAKYEGLIFPARGSGVIHTQIFLALINQQSAPFVPVGTVFSEVSRNPIHIKKVK